MVTQLGTGEPLRDVRVTLTGGSGARSVYRDGAKILVFASTGHSHDRQNTGLRYTAGCLLRNKKQVRGRSFTGSCSYSSTHRQNARRYELSDDAGTSRDIHLEHDKP